MNADTSITKAFTEGMINNTQKETIQAKAGNPAQVNALLDEIHRYISGEPETRFKQFLDYLRNMKNTELIANSMQGEV